LNEAKGAIEILLGEAYARRDHVALIAFRGVTAEVLLPPTRSLVQTKRRLASLPGGGGTPLAAGINAAIDLAEQARKRGQTPTVVTLTDGRTNVALDGTANRISAAADATTAAKRLSASQIDAIMIDTGQRPEQALQSLAKTMGAHYIPLPRADAKSLSATVTTTLQAK
jgi:magnesium chelatase subunit D